MAKFTQPWDDLYPHLFSPLKIGKHTIKNRVFVAPTHIPRAAGLQNILSPAGMAHFGSFARGGAGVVHIGETLLDRRNSAVHDSHINVIDEECLKGFHDYTEYVHIFGGKASIEFNHSGHFATPEIGDGSQPMSASAMRMPSGVEVREMNEDDMEYVAHIYCKAANMVKRGGFDMILMHLAHGWLMGGFLSPILNKRTDKYGGSVENRMRFPLMVLERVRKTVGQDFLIEVRLNGDECVPEGIRIEDAIENVRMLQDYADLVHISTGNRFIPHTRAIIHPTHFIEEGHNVHLATAVKKAGDIRIPVGALGGIDSPEFAENVIAEGLADYILMARGWIADPDWANKARAGRAEDIRPCIRCLRCLDIPLGKRNVSVHNLMDIFDEFPTTTRRADCSVNMFFGCGQSRLNVPAATEKKKVVVVGGGPAGMVAALSAARRGHEVILMEKTGELGGQLHYARHVWFKKDMERYRAYLERQVRKADIDLRLNTLATPKRVYALGPDAVIVAIGAESLIPRIPGVDLPHVHAALDIFGNEQVLGKKVAVIGGGLVGCETALHLAHEGREVVIVEMADIMAPDGIYTERLHTLQMMDENPAITICTSTTCMAILPNGIMARDKEGAERLIEADSVVLCAGMKSLAEQRDDYENVAFDVISVGDCLKVGTVSSASSTGFDAGLRL